VHTLTLTCAYTCALSHLDIITYMRRCVVNTVRTHMCMPASSCMRRHSHYSCMHATLMNQHGSSRKRSATAGTPTRRRYYARQSLMLTKPRIPSDYQDSIIAQCRHCIAQHDSITHPRCNYGTRGCRDDDALRDHSISQQCNNFCFNTHITLAAEVALCTSCYLRFIVAVL
jgi:hypothetical protein